MNSQIEKAKTFLEDKDFLELSSETGISISQNIDGMIPINVFECESIIFQIIVISLLTYISRKVSNLSKL